MTATKRTRLAPAARRAQLIELGVDLLATRRLDELSVELIADTAGISRGLLFHYFASKHEFHVEVARAAAEEVLRRTAPDPALGPLEGLRESLAAFVDYVEHNRDSYLSLVRGAVSGDADLRSISEDTRTAMAARIVDGLGEPLDARARLAVHGWIAYTEDCIVRWVQTPTIGREELLELLTRSLPALIAALDGDNGEWPAS